MAFRNVYSYPKEAFGKKKCNEIRAESGATIVFNGSFNGFTNVTITGTKNQVKVATEMFENATEKYHSWRSYQQRKKARSRQDFVEQSYPTRASVNTSQSSHNKATSANRFAGLEVEEQPTAVPQKNFGKVRGKFVPLRLPETISLGGGFSRSPFHLGVPAYAGENKATTHEGDTCPKFTEADFPALGVTN